MDTDTLSGAPYAGTSCRSHSKQCSFGILSTTAAEFSRRFAIVMPGEFAVFAAIIGSGLPYLCKLTVLCKKDDGQTKAAGARGKAISADVQHWVLAICVTPLRSSKRSFLARFAEFDTDAVPR
jgi:hypothetical protein